MISCTCEREALNEGTAGEPALYHLDEDPEEKYDRAAMYPDLVARLQAAMKAFDAEARR